VIDTRGETVTTFDGAGHPLRVRDVLGGETVSTYGPFGNLRSVTDPGGSMAITERDAFGRVKRSVDPDRGETVTHYSGFGEASDSVDALGQTTTLFHDGLGRLVYRRDADGDTFWTWDTAPNGIGEIAEVRSPGGFTKKWSYDGAGRPIATELNLEGETFKVGLAYDAESRLKTVTYPAVNGAPLVVRNDWDEAGHLIGVRDGATQDIYWRLDGTDGAGRITAEHFGNGLTTTRAYDEARARLSSVLTQGAKVVQDLAYSYDDFLNLSSRTDHLQLLLAQEETFEHDALSRLTCASFSFEAPCARSWKYAADGSLLESPDAGTYSYEPGRPHIVASTQLGGYEHDALGRQTSRPGGKISYTAFDLPKSIIQANGPAVVFDYDGNGARLRKMAGDIVSVYVDELYERVKNTWTGEIEHRHYVYGPERAVAVVVMSSVGTTKRYLHVDHLGSVDVVTNEQGGELERRSYTPFGARRNPAWGQKGAFNTSNATAVGFTGHIGDEELGLVFMRGRMYDPKLGRFLSPDPVVANALSGQDWQPYSYVGNNPLGMVDPSGFEGEGLGKSYHVDTVTCMPDGTLAPSETIYVEGPPPEPEYEPLPGRYPVDFGSVGNTPSHYVGPMASGAVEVPQTGWSKAKDFLEGFALRFTEDAARYAVDAVILGLGGPGFYLAYKGLQLGAAAVGEAMEGYKEGGVGGALASALNVFNPLAHAAVAVAGIVDAAEHGDYEAVGAHT